MMIEKQIGNFRVEKLRTIILFDPEFNQNNKLLGRNMMHEVTEVGAIA